MRMLRMAAAMATMVCGLACAARGQVNLLENGDFEDGLDPWTVTGTVQHMEVTDWHPRSPPFSFGLGNDKGPEEAGAILTQEVQLPTPLALRKRCTFSVWAMPEPNYGGDLDLEILCVDTQGVVLDQRREPCPIRPGSDWNRVWVVMLVPQDTAALRVSCITGGIPTGSGLSFLWLDDASLRLE